MKDIIKNRQLYLLALPGFLFLIVFAYAPLTGHLLAFKQYNASLGILGSKWIGFVNFKFFFQGSAWLTVTGNTIILNALFITFNLTFGILIAIVLNEVKWYYFKRISQSLVFLPYFISWMVVQFMVYVILNTNNGLANTCLTAIGFEKVDWYSRPDLWRAILTIIGLWKWSGYNSIIFLASIAGISSEYYESAKIDGASRLQQIMHITLPLIRSTAIILVLLSIGRIFYGDFGMIYGIVRDNGLLYPTTDVIDTYSFRALRLLGNFGMAGAVILYQSFMGLITVTVFNSIIRRVDPESRLY